LHGGPKFSPDGRFVYFASRDGWISKYDLWGLTLVAEVRAGLNTRNAAVSSDGRIVAVANYLPHSLVLLDDRLQLLKIIDVADISGQTRSRVSAVYDAAPRRSFVAALKDGGLRGAGLDVTDPEPLPRDSELWRLPNVIITPHISSQTLEARQRMAAVAIENVRRYVAGEKLLNEVNLKAGY